MDAQLSFARHVHLNQYSIAAFTGRDAPQATTVFIPSFRVPTGDQPPGMAPQSCAKLMATYLEDCDASAVAGLRLYNSSIMLLTSLEVWIVLDKVVITDKIPLLSEY
ncbi:hypothetical protein BV22DRAFT_1033910 [Leucogyrophana mollusca]|uniref:Uncharacterized protein n=1 Tax=Leucogyrophana mollusca TaxID=85980 RepID=A0ACB8BJT0_9AGAM|nr:hypothetical protein BV22DRAFT_1033910 [Leucogyrophana mollusca]